MQLHENNANLSNPTEYVKAGRHPGHIGINFWGFIGGFGPECLFPIFEKFKALAYIEILEFYFLPTLEMLCLYPPPEGPPLRLVQDNCMVHRAIMVQQWFQLHNIEIG